MLCYSWISSIKQRMAPFNIFAKKNSTIHIWQVAKHASAQLLCSFLDDLEIFVNQPHEFFRYTMDVFREIFSKNHFSSIYCYFSIYTINRDHSFNTYAKVAAKLIFLTPWHAPNVCVSGGGGVRYINSSENLVCILNEWPHANFK